MFGMTAVLSRATRTMAKKDLNADYEVNKLLLYFLFHFVFKKRCHRLSMSSAHCKLEKLQPVVFKFVNPIWQMVIV